MSYRTLHLTTPGTFHHFFNKKHPCAAQTKTYAEIIGLKWFIWDRCSEHGNGESIALIFICGYCNNTVLFEEQDFIEYEDPSIDGHGNEPSQDSKDEGCTEEAANLINGA